MGRFLEDEKPRQAAFKQTSSSFSSAARHTGKYKQRTICDYCLPVDNAEENLVPEIRQAAQAFFAAHRIKWHDGYGGKPSNHMCDSQVCCVNFLFPFAHRPAELAQVLQPHFPGLLEMLPIEAGQYVTFEYVGAIPHLKKELKNERREHTRGVLFTSADAAVRFRRTDGKIQVVLIEWKYTESYYGTALHLARMSQTDRRGIYQEHFDALDCPLDKSQFGYDDLFYEPFYQFMRQQFLAYEMEKVHELEADVVSVLHIVPDHNKDFTRITSKALQKHGTTATSVWTVLVRTPDRFQSISTEALFGSLTAEQLPEMRAWLEYIQARYPWVRESAPGNSGIHQFAPTRHLESYP